MERVRRIFKNVKSTLTVTRIWLGGTYAEYLLAALIFAILTIILTNFVAFNINNEVFTLNPGDGTGGFLWYNFAQPGIDPVLHHSNLVNYPYGEDIGGPTFLTYWGLWLPLRLLASIFGPVAGANLFMIFAYVLSALSMYWLVKKLVKSIPVAYFAAYAVAFAPYTLHKSLDHIAYILSYTFVFIIAGFIAVILRPTLLRAILLALAIALAFYTDGYYILLSIVLVVCMCIAAVAYVLFVRMSGKEVLKRLKYLLITLAALIVFISPIAYLQFFKGGEIKASLEGRRTDISAEIHTYRANVSDLILPAMNNPIFDQNDQYYIVQEYRNQRSNPSENTNYLGFVLIGLMAVGVSVFSAYIFVRKKSSLKKLDTRSRNAFILVGCITAVSIPVMLAFMFSPEVTVLGHTIPLPGKFFIDHNITLWRVMSRFFVTLHVIIVLFAALSLWLVLKLSKISKLKANTKRVVVWGITLLLLIVLAGEYATMVNRPSFDFSTRVNQAYYWLKEQDDIKAVVELPVVDPLDYRTAEYVTNQVVHGKALVNSKENQKANLTNVLGGISNPEAIDWAYQRGAQAAITHGEKCVDVSWGKVLYKDDKSKENAICIYKINQPVTNDKQFIKYGKGFIQRPNADNQEDAVIEKNNAIFEIANNGFTKSNGLGRISLILNTNPSLLNSELIFSQNGEVINTHTVLSKSENVTFDVNASKPVVVTIKTPEGQVFNIGDFVFKQVIVTESAR